MVIGYRSTGTGSTAAAATSIVTNSPTGVLDGDALLWTLCLNTSTTTTAPATPAGWSVLSAFQTVGTTFSQAQITWFRAASSEPATRTISSLASGRYASLMEAYTGVDLTTIEDVTNTNATSTSTQVANPAITPITQGAWIIAIEADSAASGVTGTTYSSSNMTVTGTISSTAPSTINGALGSAYLDTWASGSFTPNLVPTGTIARSTATTIALRPSFLPLLVMPPRNV